MGRQIVTERDIERAMVKRDQGQLAAGGGDEVPKKPDPYSDRLVKNIPAEVVAIYVFLAGLVMAAGQEAPPWLLWAVFLALLAATPLYLKRVQKVTKVLQLLIATAAFAVWVFSLGAQSPFATLPWYRPIFGAVLLPIFTLAVAILTPEDTSG